MFFYKGKGIIYAYCNKDGLIRKSHHLKVLADNEIVTSRKEANWIHYKLNDKKMKEITEFLQFISNDKKDCICKK